jgi:hypothetical protein
VKRSPGIDFHAPGVLGGIRNAFLVEQVLGELTHRELLDIGRAFVGGGAAIHVQGLGAAIGIAVVVLEGDGVVGAGQDPGAGAVVAHVQGNADLGLSCTRARA